MQENSYAERAKKRFVRGMPLSTPVDLVEKGYRSIDQWLQTLKYEREIEERMIVLKARETCRFLDDSSLRFQIFRIISDERIYITKDIHVQMDTRKIQLSHLRKTLKRMSENHELSETFVVMNGLEVTAWQITDYGMKEYQAHLGRVGQ